MRKTQDKAKRVLIKKLESDMEAAFYCHAVEFEQIDIINETLIMDIDEIKRTLEYAKISKQKRKVISFFEYFLKARIETDQ